MGFFDNLSKNIETVKQGASKIADAASHEVDRAMDETRENITKDCDDIAGAIKNRGFVGGAIEAADVFSPGHQFANGLDAWNVIPEDESLKQLVSAGVNIVTPSGGLGLLLGAKDISDAIGAIKTDKGRPDPFQNCPPALGADSPAHVLTYPDVSNMPGWTKPEFDMPRLWAKPSSPAPGDISVCMYPENGGDQRPPPHCGNGGGVHGNPGGSVVGYGSITDGLISRIEDILAKVRGQHKANPQDEVEAEINKILSNPNLCFEDMIFALMRAVMKGSQKEAKAMSKELRDGRAGDKEQRAKLDGQLATAQEKMAGAAPNSKEFMTAQGNVEAARNALADFKSDKADSRAEMFEDLKNIMQKVGEMQQAMSNVLNSMHESSMAAIRNIR